MLNCYISGFVISVAWQFLHPVKPNHRKKITFDFIFLFYFLMLHTFCAHLVCFIRTIKFLVSGEFKAKDTKKSCVPMNTHNICDKVRICFSHFMLSFVSFSHTRFKLLIILSCRHWGQSSLAYLSVWFSVDTWFVSPTVCSLDKFINESLHQETTDEMLCSQPPNFNVPVFKPN